jgi:hypothetical protein
MARTQVAFHATPVSSSAFPGSADGILIFDNALYNVGNCYDPATGVFTAKHAGLYFFIVTTGMEDINSEGAIHALFVDGAQVGVGGTFQVISKLSRPYITGPVHAAVHLKPGNKAWVVGKSAGAFKGKLFAMFSGFMISRDFPE